MQPDTTKIWTSGEIRVALGKVLVGVTGRRRGPSPTTPPSCVISARNRSLPRTQLQVKEHIRCRHRGPPLQDRVPRMVGPARARPAPRRAHRGGRHRDELRTVARPPSAPCWTICTRAGPRAHRRDEEALALAPRRAPPAGARRHGPGSLHARSQAPPTHMLETAFARRDAGGPQPLHRGSAHGIHRGGSWRAPRASPPELKGAGLCVVFVDRILRLDPGASIEILKNVSATRSGSTKFPGCAHPAGALLVETFEQATQLAGRGHARLRPRGRLDRVKPRRIPNLVGRGPAHRDVPRRHPDREPHGRAGTVAATAAVTGQTVATAMLDVTLVDDHDGGGERLRGLYRTLTLDPIRLAGSDRR